MIHSPLGLGVSARIGINGESGAIDRPPTVSEVTGAIDTYSGRSEIPTDPIGVSQPDVGRAGSQTVSKRFAEGLSMVGSRRVR